MRRLFLITIACAALGACANSGPEGNPWYQMGDANYDDVKRAHDACVAKGGDYQLKDGGDPTHLGDYACNPKKAS